MPFNLKKILIIVGFIIVVIGIGFGIYFAFFKAPAPAPEAPVTEAPATGGGLPISGLAKPLAPGAPEEIITPAGLPSAKTISTADLSLSGASSITMSSDGQAVQYYDSNSGLFYRVNANGTLTPLSNTKFFQVQNATWSNDSSKAVLEYPDGSNIVYDFTTDRQLVTLPKHWQDFEFTPNGDKIVSKSIGDDVNNRWLIISDANGTNSKVISALGDNADKVEVAMSPDSQVVGFSRTGDPTGEFGTQEVYLIGQNNENFKSLKVKGFNFKAEWAKEGGRILYSVADPANGYKPTLWVTDAEGDNVGTNSVKVNLDTFVDKCAIVSGYKAYCAVPKSLDEGTGLDSRLATETDDQIYFVDLRTGATSFIGAPENAYSIDKISVSSDENYIYFTDKTNGGLHQMKIK